MRRLPALFLQLLVVAAFRCCAYALRAALNTRLLDGRKRNDSTPELRRDAYRCNCGHGLEKNERRWVRVLVAAIRAPQWRARGRLERYNGSSYLWARGCAESVVGKSFGKLSQAAPNARRTDRRTRSRTHSCACAGADANARKPHVREAAAAETRATTINNADQEHAQSEDPRPAAA